MSDEVKDKTIKRFKKIRTVMLLFIPYVIAIFSLIYYLNPFLKWYLIGLTPVCVGMAVGGYFFMSKRIKKLEGADEKKVEKWSKRSEQTLQIPENMKIPFWTSFILFLALGILSTIIGLNKYGLILVFGSVISAVFFINVILIYNNTMSEKSRKSYQTFINSMIIMIGCWMTLNISSLNEMIEMLTFLIFIIFTIIAIIGFGMSVYYGIEDKKSKTK